MFSSLITKIDLDKGFDQVMKQIIAKTYKGISADELDKIIKNLLINFHPEDEIEIEHREYVDCSYVVIDKIKDHSHLRVIK